MAKSAKARPNPEPEEELNPDVKESENSDQAVESLQDTRVPEPDLVSRAASRHEEDVSQQGGRGQPHPGYRRRQV